MDDQKRILRHYKDYISKLSNSLEDIKSISAKNKKFAIIQNDFLRTIETLIESSKEQMTEVMNGTVWDKLVIAFFGETNAGKSTIIEALRAKFNDPVRLLNIQKNNGDGVDGLIIGDGRPDYTQIYEKYNLQIDGQPFILIDVPGIEGKEANYLDEIRNALKQAHCVFYIHGHNKKPDSATAGKIKMFLSDWVDVYSIYNVRGGVSNYDEEEEREKLLSEDVIKVQESIKSVFSEVLPSVYKGNITCQGLLALISVANFHKSREDLISKQEKILSFFSDKKEIENFSHFKDIIDLITLKSSDFKRQILNANKQKLTSLSQRIYNSINTALDSQNESLNSYAEQLRNFKIQVSSIMYNEVSSMKSKLYSEITEFFGDLKLAANDVIDYSKREDWQSDFQQKFSLISKNFNLSIKEVFRETIECYNNKIELKRKDLDKLKHNEVVVDFSDYSSIIDFSIVIKKMTGSWKDLLKIIVSKGDIFHLLLSKSDDGRPKAKQQVRDLLVREEPELKSSVFTYADRIKNHLVNDNENILRSANVEINNIDILRQDLQNLKSYFKK